MAAEPMLSRRGWCQRALLLPAVAGLGGCVVAPYGTYFRPSSTQPGARGRGAWCQGQAGPMTGLELDLGGGLQLRAWTEKSEPAGVPLRVALTVPRQTSLKFTDAVRLVAADGQSLGVAWSASAQRTIAVDPTSWLDPQALRPGAAASARDAAAPNGLLRAQVQPVAGPAPQRILVQGLALERDSGRVPVPPVAMARPASRTQPGTYRSDEEQAAARARADACRRATPDRACDNIVEFAQASHVAQAAGARWDWRWWTTTLGGAEAVQGELSVASADAGRWRLDASGFQLRDVDAGTVRPLRLAAMQLSFDDRLDPRAGVAAAPAETRLLLEALLPQGSPDFELRLPALLRNGAPVAVAPLRFERRSFDGGVQPFNC